ncbi:MAG TPA: adenylate/guanylate cyclase domain-containing protein, partial [Bacteroidia bacterium]|nr:adenylate/guanylate cyclase domain-containing protein [Bacteroidia bacterium]
IMRNVFIIGFFVMSLFAGIFLVQRNRIAKAKKQSDKDRKRSDKLLVNVLPTETANELKARGNVKAKSYAMVTVMFVDFKNFTSVSESMSPNELVDELNFYFREFDRIITKHKIEKIKTLGDGYMCAGGLPVENITHAADTVYAALEIQHFLEHLKQERIQLNRQYFEARIGIHSGPVISGIVGLKKFAYDIWGDTVNIASRMESCGEVGKVNISSATHALLKNKFTFSHRGSVETKNKVTFDMYFVNDVVPAEIQSKRKKIYSTATAPETSGVNIKDLLEEHS